MSFEPSVIVVIVYLIEHTRAEYLSHSRAHPIPARVSVRSRQAHGLDVIIADLALHRKHARLNVHPVDRARCFEKRRSSLMSQPARAKVNADPDPLQFVGEHINVMIAGADSAELLLGHLL